jgi:stage II sporulation protein AA (anti-sigma F factor antagonist)
MLVLARRLKDARGALALCAMGAPVRHVFELAGFMPLFAVDSTREAAVERVGGA